MNSAVCCFVITVLAVVTGDVVTWSGASHTSNRWDDSANWTPHSPAQTDTVNVLDCSARHPLLAAEAPTQIVKLTVGGKCSPTILAATVIMDSLVVQDTATLFLAGGPPYVLSPKTGSVMSGATLNFKSGLLAGDWTIAKGGTIVFGDANPTLSNARITLAGSMRFNSSSSALATLTNASSITNNGQIDIEAAQTMRGIFGASDCIVKSTSDSATTIRLAAGQTAGVVTFAVPTQLVNLRLANGVKLIYQSSDADASNVVLGDGATLTNQGNNKLTFTNISGPGTVYATPGAVMSFTAQLAVKQLLVESGGAPVTLQNCVCTADTVAIGNAQGAIGGLTLTGSTVTAHTVSIFAHSRLIGGSVTGDLVQATGPLIDHLETELIVRQTLSSVGNQQWLLYGGSIKISSGATWTTPGQLNLTNANPGSTRPILDNSGVVALGSASTTPTSLFDHMDVKGAGNYTVVGTLELGSTSFTAGVVLLNAGSVFSGLTSVIDLQDIKGSTPAVVVRAIIGTGGMTIICGAHCGKVHSTTPDVFSFTGATQQKLGHVH